METSIGSWKGSVFAKVQFVTEQFSNVPTTCGPLVKFGKASKSVRNTNFVLKILFFWSMNLVLIQLNDTILQIEDLSTLKFK